MSRSGEPSAKRWSWALKDTSVVPLAPHTTVETPVFTDEQALGEHLMRLVAAARERGQDPERALRGAIRSLEVDVRAAETAM